MSYIIKIYYEYKNFNGTGAIIYKNNEGKHYCGMSWLENGRKRGLKRKLTTSEYEQYVEKWVIRGLDN